MVLLIAICFSPSGVLVLQKGLGTRALEFRKYPSWCSIAGAFLEQGLAYFFCKESESNYFTFCESATQFCLCRAKVAVASMETNGMAMSQHNFI